MTDELKREFAGDKETKYNLDYLADYTAKDMNIFNEFKYFAHTSQYVSENYAYDFMSITAYKIANAFGIKPYNAFTRLRYMVMGDSLKYLMQYLTVLLK